VNIIAALKDELALAEKASDNKTNRIANSPAKAYDQNS
jgi:hypothetical protein